MVLAGVLGAVVTYPVARHHGYKSGYSIGQDRATGWGCFHKTVAFLAALQKIRAGDTQGATDSMEKTCFDSAHTFFKNPTPGYPDAGTVKEIAKELSEYRATYRTNTADWDDMERKLDAELAKVK